MRLSKAVKIIVGIFSAWEVLSPLLLLTYWFFFVFVISISESQSHAANNILPFLFFPLPFLIVCTTVVSLGLRAFYIVHIILNKRGTDLLRAILGVGLFILPFLAIPFYYFIYVLPENPPIWALTPESA